MSRLSDSITVEQLADHNTLESMWIAVRGHVYDLTAFSSDHPGGIEVLESCAGTDGTEPYEYAGHSESNMAKMQQYHVGRLVGSLEEAPATSHKPIHVKDKRLRSDISRLEQLRFPHRTKIAVAISGTFLVMALFYQRRNGFVNSSSPALNIPQLQFKPIPGQNIGYAFWAGMAVASLVGFVGFSYLYKLFSSTLDYGNEVFNFPSTIPRTTRR
ncbi:cytochrome b5-like heme/steroid binding domain-containing protein [Xylaria acuta]|nr:cytochrome b5-like heme/steroid binding domain-containing protein [Xylaria acuta]